MKKLICILFPLIIVSLLIAVDFDFDGEYRARAVMYNDADDRDGGYIDNKLLLGMNASIWDDLDLRVNLQFGDIIWGDGDSGGGIAAGIPVKAYELYIDYRIAAISSNIRVGQQYWADHRSIMIDDSFSGILLSKEDLLGFEADLGWMKLTEGEYNNSDDDTNSFLLSLQTEKPLPWGLQSFYTRNAGDKTDIITLLPFATVGLQPLSVDLVGIFQYASVDGENDMDLGVSARATAEIGRIAAGMDVLYYNNEDSGLNYSISNYYMNELYIFGIGRHHDMVCLYWGETANEDMYLATVGFAKAGLCEKLKAFAAVGMVADTGYEVNGGLEYDLIPETLQLSAYGAYGKHTDNDFGNYLFGTTLKATF